MDDDRIYSVAAVSQDKITINDFQYTKFNRITSRATNGYGYLKRPSYKEEMLHYLGKFNWKNLDEKQLEEIIRITNGTI